MDVGEVDPHLAELEQQTRALAADLVRLRHGLAAVRSGVVDPDRPLVSAERVQRELRGALDHLHRSQVAVRRLLEDLGTPGGS